MTTYTDEQLKQALAKMLPDKLRVSWWNGLEWNPELAERAVFDTELLYLCSLVESGLIFSKRQEFRRELQKTMSRGMDGVCLVAVEECISAPWQQRTVAAAKVKGVEIV